MNLSQNYGVPAHILLSALGHNLPVLWTRRLIMKSFLHELFTDCWYSAERWTVAESRKAMASFSKYSLGSVSIAWIIAVNKSWWTDHFPTSCPYPPFRWPDSRVLALCYLLKDSLWETSVCYYTLSTCEVWLLCFSKYVLILFWC